MNDDWRLQVNLSEDAHARTLIERLDANQLRHDLSEEFHDRVIVTCDGSQLFLYAGTREQVEKARSLVEDDARRHDWTVDVDLRRWHPLAEEWEDPDKALPDDDVSRRAEREALMAREREETARRGYPEFEVRIDLPSRHAAIRLSEHLHSEGIAVVRRWKYLLIGATDEDSAKMLAERIQREAPQGSQAKVEGTWAAVYEGITPSPFSLLGGLGG